MKQQNHFRRFLLIFLLSMAGFAQAANTFTYQGQLENNNGPIDGTVDLTFSLFDAESSGSLIGSPINLNNVDVSRGLFQVELDFGQAFDGNPVWIEIEVEGSTLSPRQRVTAVPMAKYAFSGPSDNSNWQVSGSDIWYTDGNVGIGTSSPAATLEVSGSAAFGSSAQAEGDNSFAGGGGHNSASGTNSFVGGGGDNTASMLNSFVGGGSNNNADGTHSFVAGGSNNTASGNSSFAAGSGGQATGESSFSGGGVGNEASGIESFIAGGRTNKADGRGAFVGGGIDNVADGQFSFAAGRRAEAQHDGSFVWASGPLSAFSSSDDNQFLIRAHGGVGINTNEPGAALHVMGDTAVGGFSEDHRLGVGTDNPWSPLHVVSNDDQGPMRAMVGNNNASSTAIRAYSHQGVAIGNSWTDSGVPDRGLRVHGMTRLSGDLHIRGTWSSTQAHYKICADYGASFGTGWYYLYPCNNGESSSRRYKEDIRPLKSASELVEGMQAVSFRWKESGDENIGLVAEDVAEVEPRLVFENKHGEIEGIHYSHLTAVLVRAMQERSQAVDADLAAVREAHKAEVASRDAEIAALRQELDEQRASYNKRLAALEALLLDDVQVAGKQQVE